MIIVSHWTNIYPDIATTAKFPSCFAQCAAVLKYSIPDQMGSKITVSYSEPGFITKNCELVKHRGEIILYTPSEFSFDSGERVNYSINIRADFQTVPCEIVADITYDTYRVCRMDLLHPVYKSCGTYSARNDYYLSFARCRVLVGCSWHDSICFLLLNFLI